MQLSTGDTTPGDTSYPKFCEGVFANVIDRVELMNSANVKMGTLHGESFGFFDIHTNKLPSNEKDQLLYNHNYALPETRVNDTKKEYADSVATPQHPKVFRCKLPFWCLGQPNKCLPMAYLSGETYVLITFNDLSLTALDNAGYTPVGTVTGTGGSMTMQFPVDVEPASSSDIRSCAWGTTNSATGNDKNVSNGAVQLMATYVRLPDAHMMMYYENIMRGPTEFASATQEKMLIRKPLTKKA